MDDFYIYIHLTHDDGVPFYVGKGRGKRAYSKHARSSLWNNVVAKHSGFKVEFLAENLNEEQAHCHERRFISFYGRRDLRLGPLVNLTDGGEGVRGNFGNQNWKFRVETDETRRRKSESHKGKKRPDHSLKMMGNSWHRSRGIGYKQSEECKQKLRLANLGKRATTQVRAKMSESQRRRWANAKAQK